MTELEKIGKKMPYTLPEGSLEALQQRVLATRRPGRPVRRGWWGWALAGAAALALLFTLHTTVFTPDPYEELLAAFDALDSEDQAFVLECIDFENL
ncbi:MAG: hypothetical protein IJS62_07035 [Bacteroidales bacterium]|nr:hypothetical protein [Bacteroidales bacterium]